MKQQGITLIELLIALVIAVSIGVAAVVLLDSAVGLEEQIEDQTRTVSQLDATFRQLSQGFSQTVQQRPVMRTFGREPAVKLFENQLTLVQNGWQQLPNDERPRSSMRRVNYRLVTPCPNKPAPEVVNEDAPQYGCIVRTISTQLDTDDVALDSFVVPAYGERTNISEGIQVQYLVEDVQAWGVTLLTSDGLNLNSVNEFPPVELDVPVPPIVGVEVLINHRVLGNIKRTFYVGQGFQDFQALPEQAS
ncbi:PulJ/GspJ family protein [Salinibius halmophilus]|uniref:PulJ/GspJ family protein n=1 Tax=Salinibius halmophilus TaxID=1853216 RepID=UPI000E660C4A|nr:prepilin-type N-terminal cleavage/methylation domain-containing protein [Salinibius halmophilus]